MSPAPLSHLKEKFEALSLPAVERNGVGEPCHLEAQTGGLDLGTAEGQFLLGLHYGNLILAALYAPVERKVG